MLQGVQTESASRRTTWGKRAIGLVSSLCLGLFVANTAHAEDSIRLVDSSDLQFYTHTPAAAQPQEPVAGVTLNIDEGLLGGSVEEEDKSVIQLSAPRATPTGFSLGMEISLDDPDKVTLQDRDRIYLEGSFGQMAGFEQLEVQSGTGLLPSVLDGDATANALSFLRRASALNVDALELTALTTQPGTMVPQYAGVSLGFSTGERLLTDPSQRGFEIALTSMVMMQAASENHTTFMEAAGITREDRVYNVGLNVGYRGFTFVASFLRGENDINATYESYDVGLQYDFGSWATTLAVGGYFGSDSPLSYANILDIDRIYSVEIGASYAIRPWMTVQGRFQFFDYRTLLGTSGLDGYGGTFFLGTSLGF
jgi:hypothetical protein